MSAAAPILQLDGITKKFGGFTALSDVHFTVEEKVIHAVIGPNGAGKTTLFNVISGMFGAEAGSLLFKGENIDRAKPHKRANMGIARTFQNIRLFEDLSVLENVQVSQHGRHFPSIWSAVRHAIFHAPFSRGAQEIEMEDYAMELLEFLGIAHARDTNAADLAFGERRLVEIARALAANPAIMLLDEPAAGMNPSETENLDEILTRLRDEKGITILLVEHDMNLVMGLSDYVTVLNFGEKIAEGAPEAVQSDPDVIAAYLGTDEEI